MQNDITIDLVFNISMAENVRLRCRIISTSGSRHCGLAKRDLRKGRVLITEINITMCIEVVTNDHVSPH